MTARSLQLSCPVSAPSHSTPSRASSAPSAGSRMSSQFTVWLRGNGRYALMALLLVLGAVAFARSFGGVSPAAVMRACGRVGAGVWLVFMAPVIGQGLHMLGWRWLLPTGK